MTRLEDEYDEVFHTLSRVELQSGAPGLADLDVSDLFGDRDEKLWLGFYTTEGLNIAFERYGFFDDFREVGYEGVRVETRCDDPDEHLLRIWAENPAVEGEPLIELVCRREYLCPDSPLRDILGQDCIAVLTVEWLQMQNPRRRFTEDRPPLPGQHFPGLGLGEQVAELLKNATRRLGLHGLTTVPSFFHNAMLYNLEFNYFDPREQGVLEALARDVMPAAGSMAAASWAVKWGMVVDAEDEDSVFEWFHDCMVVPISDVLDGYFADARYRDEVDRARESTHFRVLEDALTDALEAKGVEPLDRDKIRQWIEE